MLVLEPGQVPVNCRSTLIAGSKGLWVEGGAAATADPCQGRSAHGFLGLDREVVGTIVAWIEGLSKTAAVPDRDVRR